MSSQVIEGMAMSWPVMQRRTPPTGIVGAAVQGRRTKADRSVEVIQPASVAGYKEPRGGCYEWQWECHRSSARSRQVRLSKGRGMDGEGIRTERQAMEEKSWGLHSLSGCLGNQVLTSAVGVGIIGAP